MNKNKLSLFVKIGIFNLTIVAMIGTLMRYKIGFDFPYLDQKYLLHGHSHFAFAGWVTHILFTLLVAFLNQQNIYKKMYDKLIWANLLCAYGMLISFIIQGYGGISIGFSSASIIVNFIFAFQYFDSLRSMPDSHPSKNWFKAALIFNVLSSIGTFYLAYMMATNNINQHAYLGSVYFYLHFQYSGWFFFAIIGLLLSKLKYFYSFSYNPNLFKFFFAACIPAYFLSILWAHLPWYIYIFPVIAVILQLMGISILLKLLKKMWPEIKEKWSYHIRLLLGLSLLALIIKLSLQAGSIFPEISKMAFGFRSIVIAYLHLVLLGFTTLFLLGFLLQSGYISKTKSALTALVLFIIGVFGNEFILMIQGIASFGYVLIPYLNELLLFVSLLMFISLVWLIITMKNSMKI
ncbi:MAG: hypothetical protein IPO26_05430 [Saprospiraceae bacterium]|nr:hypothetical protein [Saprospiraceae bacterium]MBK8826153.1 hypothetical protein [Saprospiraceae bacterium]HQV66284.1 hypothetical protein [Saprospiraceae bacterium]